MTEASSEVWKTLPNTEMLFVDTKTVRRNVCLARMARQCIEHETSLLGQLERNNLLEHWLDEENAILMRARAQCSRTRAADRGAEFLCAWLCGRCPGAEEDRRRIHFLLRNLASTPAFVRLIDAAGARRKEAESVEKTAAENANECIDAIEELADAMLDILGSLLPAELE